jgi:hypothetical protein
VIGTWSLESHITQDLKWRLLECDAM